MHRFHILALAGAWLFACAPDDVSSSAAGAGGTGAEQESSTGSGEETEGSSGAEIPPPPACDARFDRGLSSGEVVWTEVFPVNEDAEPKAIAVAATGEVFAVGRRSHEIPSGEGWYLHLAPHGPVMTQVFATSEYKVDFDDVAPTPSGNIIVAAQEWIEAGALPIVRSISPLGIVQWRITLDLGPDGEVGVEPLRVVVSSAGRIVVGVGVRRADRSTIELVELSPAGDVVQRFAVPPDAPSELSLRDIGIDEAGVLHAGARSDVADTSIAWVGRWDPSGSFTGGYLNEEPGARPIESVPHDGGVAVLTAEYADGAGGDHHRVRPKLRYYDAAGDEQWARTIEFEGSPDEDYAPGAHLTRDCEGDLLVHVSYILHTGEPVINWVVRLDAAGVELDRRLVDTDLGLGRYQARIHDIATDPFGNLVVVMSQYQPDALIVQKLAR